MKLRKSFQNHKIKIFIAIAVGLAPLILSIIWVSSQPRHTFDPRCGNNGVVDKVVWSIIGKPPPSIANVTPMCVS